VNELISLHPEATTSDLAPQAQRCPFHDGATTIDLLLAEIDFRNVTLFDAVLDLRYLCAAGQDAAACVEQLFRIRALLGEQHYLAFYRVRCWARRALLIQVRAQRNAPWSTCELPLNGARLDEIVNAALASLPSQSGTIPDAAHVRFAFAAAD
jgi:hypothetical protein